MAYKRLGDILTSVDLITEDQLNEALEKGKQTNKRLGQVLIDTGVITENQLIDVLKLQLGVDFVDLTKVSIPSSLTSLVPKNIAKKYSVVPVKLVGDSLYLAMEDPLNFVAVEEVRNASKKRVVPMISTHNATARAITTLYGNEGISQAIDELRRNITEDSMVTPVAEENDVEDETQAAPAIRVVNSVIERAVAENASDIHLEPREDGLIVRMRIDGVLHNILTIEKNLQNAITSRIKIMGDMDISERRIPQDGRANIRVRKKDIDLRISTLPTIFGEKIVIRLLVKSADMLSTEGIGLRGDNLDKYEALLKNSNGVILIVGPTGSGKSSTMYTMVNELNSEEINLVTLEDPVEYNLDGVNQVQINEKTGMTFASGLRSILRQDPDVIAVGEIRDGETAEIAMRAAITGHLVLSTIHTNDALSTLDRLVDIGVEPYIISGALKGVISQRLVRKICPNCKQSYRPGRDELVTIGMNGDENIELYRGAGCSECLGTGYRGRTAAFEILVLNNEMKQMLRNGASSEDLRTAAANAGFVPMAESCRRLVTEGITTAAEAFRILNSTDS